MKRISFIFTLFLLSLSPAWADLEDNYIYILDCTRSMLPKNNDLWDSAKMYIENDISRDPDINRTITIVPFKNQVYQTIFHFKNDKDGLQNWPTIKNDLDQYVQIPGNTNICDAWREGLKYIDLSKDNYFYLLTDGEDKAGTDAVVALIREWCTSINSDLKTKSKVHGVYVMLPQKDPTEAKSALVAIEKIKAVGEGCISVVSGHPKVCVHLLDHEAIMLNTLDYKQHGVFPEAKLRLSMPNVSVKLESEDKFFQITAVKNGSDITIRTEPKGDIDAIRDTLSSSVPNVPHVINARVVAVDAKYDILEPEFTVQIYNDAWNALTLNQTSPDWNGKTVHWYDSFLFWGPQDKDTLRFDFTPEWNDEAKRHGSKATMSMQQLKKNGSKQVGSDYILLYNGEVREDGTFTLSANEDKSEIAIVFKENAAEENYGWEIVPKRIENVNVINQVAAEEYNQSFNAGYEVDWNPLKHILMWLGIIFVTIIVVWFLILRPLIYPKMKRISFITVTANASSYHNRTMLRGYHRVKFVGRMPKIGFWEKTFGAPVNYVVSRVWENREWEIAYHNRGGFVMHKGKYYLDPSSTMERGKQYTMQDNDTNEVINITVS